MHDKPVSFDARRYHKVEPHEGSNKFSAAGGRRPDFVRFRRTNREDMCHEMTGAHFRLCGVNGAKSALSQAAELSVEPTGAEGHQKHQMHQMALSGNFTAFFSQACCSLATARGPNPGP